MSKQTKTTHSAPSERSSSTHSAIRQRPEYRTKYLYDSFGNNLSLSGRIAEANLNRFCGKEVSATTGLTYFLYRFYSPALQRWINQEPLAGRGWAISCTSARIYSLIRQPVETWQRNNFAFLMNWSMQALDAWGLDVVTGQKPGRLCTSKNCKKDQCPVKNLPEEGWDQDVKNGKNPWREMPNPGRCADSDGFASPRYGVMKIPDNCTVTIMCDKDGYMKNVDAVQVECKGVYPDVRSAKPSDHFPPSPYDKH